MSRKVTGRMANRDQRVKWLREQNLFSLAVHAVRTRYRISNLLSKDSELDVLAEDADGQMYNIEIQRAATVDHARRLRYYGAQIDSGFLEKGAQYQDLPNVYLVYISETDLWKLGLTACTVCKSLLGWKKYEDGIQILYVNAAVDDGSERARLMRFFRTADPEDQSQGALSARIHFLKKEEGGRKEMEVFHLFARGDSLEEIHGVSDMPLAQLKQWKEEWERKQGK